MTNTVNKTVMLAKVEYTDTYGGESNYSWLIRCEFECQGMTDRQIIQRAKAELGITGKKADYRRSYNYCDIIAQYYPCTVMFITFEDCEE